MNTRDPKRTRRRILTLLYESYLVDPLSMCTPSDLLEDGTLSRDELAANAHYLYDRGLIELMVGYNPPLFAAARIAPEGVDLIEDPEKMEVLFPKGPSHADEASSTAVSLVLQVAEQAERSQIEGVKKVWLLNDLEQLRNELRRPRNEWRRGNISSMIHWIGDYFDGGLDGELPALEKLRQYIDE